MALMPQDIVRKEFREAFRGYNQSDVDLFLDEVVEEYTRVADENQKMKVRLAALQQEVARLREGKPATIAGTAPSPANEESAKKLEGEVRARVKAFLEDQIRQIESGERASSPTVERIARELGGADEGAKAPQKEPFWAGE